MLTIERLRQVVRYDPGSGVFFRLECKQRPDVLGETSKALHGNGYQRLAIDGKRYYCHRLAWFYMTGTWPEKEIDHVNGDRSDNRWSNLRSASPRLNKQNMRRARKDSKSGILGVSWDKERQKWVARINLPSGLYKLLGRFDTKGQAQAAYLSAKRRHHEGCTI